MNLDEAVARILQLGGDKVKFIILFGSRARGDARKDSDYDLCVYYEGNEKEAFRFRVLVLGNLPDKYDVQIFQLLPLPLKGSASREDSLLSRRDFSLRPRL